LTRQVPPDNDIAQRWNQEMREISTRAAMPSQPLGYYERQAQLEAEAEASRASRAELSPANFYNFYKIVFRNKTMDESLCT